ncbi:sugar O-acetyltransferase [Paenibacillus sp. S33]
MIEERLYAKSLCHEYNQLHPRNIEERETLIKTLLGKTTDRFLIEQPFVCDYGYNIEIGENFYSNHNTIMLDGAKIVFGDHVFIAPNCGFYTAGHPLDVEQRIGAGSVVTKDIPSGVIAAGNPCKVIRKITEDNKTKYKRN